MQHALTPPPPGGVTAPACLVGFCGLVGAVGRIVLPSPVLLWEVFRVGMLYLGQWKADKECVVAIAFDVVFFWVSADSSQFCRHGACISAQERSLS